MKKFELDSRFLTRCGDAFNIPANTIYFIESRTNAPLNAFVRDNLSSINAFINRALENNPLEFRYKLIYVPRHSFDDGYAHTLLSLRPDLKSRDVNQSGTPIDDFTAFDGSVICRLMPHTIHDHESIFFQTDVTSMSSADFSFFLHSYTHKVNNFNIDLINGKKPDDYGFQFLRNLFVFFNPYEGIITLKYKKGQHPLNGIDDDDEYKQKKREKAKLIARAKRINAAIERLQREGGINFLHEMLAEDTLRALRAEPAPSDLSRLVITDNFHFLLPDYDLDVHMNRTLCKVFYILFLRHPEGIRLKEIADYRDELLFIYKTISNRLDVNKMTASIDAAIDLEDPALLYQYISRANKSFRDKLSFKLSEHYVISNDRANLSTIRLTRSLVSLPDILRPVCQR